jgi:hypothetical protein
MGPALDGIACDMARAAYHEDQGVTTGTGGFQCRKELKDLVMHDYGHLRGYNCFLGIHICLPKKQMEFNRFMEIFQNGLHLLTDKYFLVADIITLI